MSLPMIVSKELSSVKDVEVLAFHEYYGSSTVSRFKKYRFLVNQIESTFGSKIKRIYKTSLRIAHLELIPMPAVYMVKLANGELVVVYLNDFEFQYFSTKEIKTDLKILLKSQQGMQLLPIISGVSEEALVLIFR
jgi:hypothetical protein